MIEVRKSEDPEQTAHQLLIDGSLIDEQKITLHHLGSNRKPEFDIWVRDVEVSQKIASHALSEVPPYINELRLKYKFDWSNVLDTVWLQGLYKRQGQEISFSFEKIREWRGIYSFTEYFEAFSRIAEQANDGNFFVFSENTETDTRYEVVFFNPSVSLPVASEIERCSNILRTFHEEAERILSARIHSDSVVMTFDFPEEIKVPCEQYLLYFVQFLRDIGVEANSELQHEAGNVLFSVRPTDPQQALDKIRTALDVYLHMPSSPISDATSESIAVQRLESNILRLRSDLKLAAAEIQAKNATIQANELTISIQKGLLSGEIIIDSLKDVTPKPKDKEEVLGGTLAIKKYEGKGFDVDLPEIFRRLKRFFSDKE
jgi:hypothetical protein